MSRHLKFRAEQNRKAVLLLWPWPWPDDLDIRNWHSYSEDVPANLKWTF